MSEIFLSLKFFSVLRLWIQQEFAASSWAEIFQVPRGLKFFRLMRRRHTFHKRIKLVKEVGVTIEVSRKASLE